MVRFGCSAVQRYSRSLKLVLSERVPAISYYWTPVTLVVLITASESATRNLAIANRSRVSSAHSSKDKHWQKNSKLAAASYSRRPGGSVWHSLPVVAAATGSKFLVWYSFSRDIFHGEETFVAPLVWAAVDATRPRWHAFLHLWLMQRGRAMLRVCQ